MWSRSIAAFSLSVNTVRLSSTGGTPLETMSRKSTQSRNKTTLTVLFPPPDLLESVLNSKCARMQDPSQEGASVWGCLECSYQSSNRHNVLAHIEAHHIVHGGHKCPICGVSSPTKNALRMHMKRKHVDIAASHNETLFLSHQE